MSTDLNEGDKVGIKRGAPEQGSWGIVRKIEGPDKYSVAIEDSNERVVEYTRLELHKWRSPNAPKSPETVSETSKETPKGQLAEGQLPALRLNYTRIRSLNEDRLFMEVALNGKPYLLSIEGLTYGTMADYVRVNKPEEVEYYEDQRQSKGN